VEAAKVIDNACNQGIDLFWIAHVALIEFRFNPLGCKLGNRLRPRLDIAIATNRDAGACCCISKSNAFADTACSAGDQCHSPAQVKICHARRLP
jgi:hypothetical protein